MKHIQTFENFLNESQLNEAKPSVIGNKNVGKKQMFLLYTDKGGKRFWYEVIEPNGYVWDQWDYTVVQPAFDNDKATKNINNALKGTGLKIDNYENTSDSVHSENKEDAILDYITASKMIK